MQISGNIYNHYDTLSTKTKNIHEAREEQAKKTFSLYHVYQAKDSLLAPTAVSEPLISDSVNHVLLNQQEIVQPLTKQQSKPSTVIKAQAPGDLFTLSPLTKDKMNNAKEIMGKYNIRNMSFNTLEKMSSELRDAGLMTDQEWLMMNPPRHNNPSIVGMAKIDMDKPIDIIATFETELGAKKRLGQNKELLIIEENRIDILHFFDSLSPS